MSMSDTNPNFHQFALQSILFKGRADWYFCFLKSEKIAHVLAHLSGRESGEAAESLRELARGAGKLPESIVRFVSGELAQEEALADALALRSAVRLAASMGDLSAENALVISAEYERIAEKLGSPGRPSPFVSTEDFSVPELPASARSLPAHPPLFIKDKQPSADKGQKIHKGLTQLESHTTEAPQKQERMARILEVVRKRGGASIRDIAAEIKDCGEKTIQRELVTLIEEGLVRKEGERRWSIYKPA